MKTQTFTHPNTWIDRISQWVALIGAVILVAALPLMAVIVALGAPGGFLLVGLVALILSTPLIMRTAVTPAVSLDDDGLTLHPLFWRTQTIPWDAIQAVQTFPLLPSEDAEVTRKVAVGRRNYRPAAGLMLVIPSLPPAYRIAGFFAGVGGQPVIALTNRAHTDYEQLIRLILEKTDPDIHDDDLLL
jgi:hypothetical protein